MMKLNKLAPPVKRWFDEGFKLVSAALGYRLEPVPVRINEQKLLTTKK